MSTSAELKTGVNGSEDLPGYVPSPDEAGEAGAARRIFDEICRLGLERNIAELELFGYTVVEPDRAAPPSFAARLRDAILAISERRSGIKPELEGRSEHGDMLDSELGRGEMAWMLLNEDRVFEEALMNEASLALITYLLGEDCLFYGSNSGIKGPGTEGLPIHCDTHATNPLPMYSLVANATWALTDYTVESGCLTMVPGSHRYCRKPQPGEGIHEQVPVITPAGSLIVWHGNTWHGALPRTDPGLRVNMAQVFCRPHMTVVEDYSSLDESVFERNPPRFATLFGRWLPFPTADGIDYDNVGSVIARLDSMYG